MTVVTITITITAEKMAGVTTAAGDGQRQSHVREDQPDFTARDHADADGEAIESLGNDTERTQLLADDGRDGERRGESGAHRDARTLRDPFACPSRRRRPAPGSWRWARRAVRASARRGRRSRDNADVRARVRGERADDRRQADDIGSPGENETEAQTYSEQDPSRLQAGGETRTGAGTDTCQARARP